MDTDRNVLQRSEPVAAKLSWDETAREIAASGEDWSEWDALGSDGLEDIEWRPCLRPNPTRLDHG